MKTLQVFLLLALFTASKCSKQEATADENSIIGKWTYTEHFYSTGSPGQWHPVVPANQKIEFKSNGKFIPSESFLKGANRFEFIDSATIKLYPATTSSGFISMRYIIKEAGRELYLYPVDPICIEGCSSKFRR